jgi:ankyrin repeat protein
MVLYCVELQESWTPLICAAGNGHLETTKILLASGADPDSTTAVRTIINQDIDRVYMALLLLQTGHSAAHMAAWKGLIDILVVLRQYGCSLNIKTDVCHVVFIL